jgi:hypothetical protein
VSNFLQFIDEDIDAKKILFSTMPTNTKTNIRKFNERITSVSSKYNEYKESVKKYLDAKSKSFNIKVNDKNIEELNKNVNTLEHIRSILNPTNTYLEKLGFDNLIYQISNYYDFNFTSLNEIINQFLDKFELAEIKLSSEDFDYTCYVNEYMSSFLEVRNSKSKNYDKVAEIFESIYWINPEIIEHIELNFRKLIKKHQRNFTDYITGLQRKIASENGIDDYEDCLEKLKVAYIKANAAKRENVCDIINLAKTGAIDIKSYFNDSKVRLSTYSSLMIDPINLSDKVVMNKFYESLEKLKNNIEEYDNYMKFVPLFDDFKKEYKSLIPIGDKDPNKSNGNKELKNIEAQIAEKEDKLEKINKRIFSGGAGLFGIKNDSTLKQSKIDAVRQAKELYNLYKVYDKEYFKDKVLTMLNSSLTISELLHLYYSFNYFKKIAIKRVFNITTYDEITKYSEDFDLFAMNPTNIIINGVALFEESNIGKVIMNKYRLDNINLTEENLNPDDLKSLLDKIQLLLRINEIENSPTTVEKIWFMAQVEKINVRESKKA